MSEGETTQGVLAQFVAQARQLYSLPAVALEVLQLTNEPGVDVDQLKTVIEKDPALTAKLLRVVNSSLFGLSRPVGDLKQAINLLGVKPLKMLVLGFSLPKTLLLGVEADMLRAYWEHALVKAVAGRELCEVQGWKLGDEAFIAGLLQDLGMLVLLQNLGEPYANFVQRVRTENFELAAVEFDHLGFDHQVLSARLLTHWRLPEQICQAIGQPFDARLTKELPDAQRSLAQVLHVAELVARLLTQDSDRWVGELLQCAESYFGLSVTEIRGLVDLLETKVPPLADVFSIPWDAETYALTIAEAHERLSCLTEVLASETRVVSPRANLAEASSLQASVQRYLQTIARQVSTCASAGPSAVEDQGAAGAPAATWSPQPSAVQVAEPHDEDPGLTGQLEQSLSACRNRRCPLSLLLLEIDNFVDLSVTSGVEEATRTVAKLKAMLEAAAENSYGGLMVREARIALVLPNYDRQQAIDLGRQIFHRVSRWPNGGTSLAPQISVGVATLPMPPRNFPVQELVSAAERCLYASRAAGGRVVKSIEL